MRWGFFSVLADFLKVSVAPMPVLKLQGHALLTLDQPPLMCLIHQAGGVFCAQLLGNVEAVSLYGAQADEEGIGNLLVGVFFGNHGQNFFFALGKQHLMQVSFLAGEHLFHHVFQGPPDHQKHQKGCSYISSGL